MMQPEYRRNMVTAIAFSALAIAGGAAWWLVIPREIEPWDTPEYFLYIFGAAFAGGLVVGIKPWWTGTALVLLPLLASIIRTVLKGWGGPFGPLEQISFVVIAAIAAGFSWVGTEARKRVAAVWRRKPNFILLATLSFPLAVKILWPD